MSIARYTINKSTSAWVVVVLLLIGGWISYNQLGRFEDPEFVIRQAVINTPYPGASAQEVASDVTDKIEAAVQQLQELKEVKSVSKTGISEVTVEISLPFAKDKAALEQVWDKLRRKIADAQSQLPAGAGPSLVNDDFADVYAQFYAITGDGFSHRQLADYASSLSKELALVPGVAKTALLGQRADRIYIEISNADLKQYGLAIENIFQALQKYSGVVSAGSFVADGIRIPVIGGNLDTSLDELKRLQIKAADGGTTFRLDAVARIYKDYVDPPSLVMSYNGQEAIGLGISNISGGNVVEMGKAVQRRLAELEEQRPLGIELHPISLQSESVEASVASFVDNLIAAIAIVFVVLLLFMGVRAGVIIGAVLLLTVAGTLIIMLMDDIAMQRISLGALIIALGMLVDNAIVVVDGVLVKLQAGSERRQAIDEVVKSTTMPLLGGTAVGILAFSAIGLSPTDMGEYAGSLFWVILYSMLLSWLFAITITPLLCDRFLKAAPMPANQPEGTIIRRYRGLLQLTLRRRLVAYAIMLSLLALALWAFRFVPPGFMPESLRPQFVVDLSLPQGSDITTTQATLAKVEQQVRSKSGVTNVTTFVGGGGLRFMLSYAPEARNPAYGQLLVDVSDYRLITALVTELQGELELAHPDASIKVWKFMLGRGGGKKIEAAFQGPDPLVLRQLAQQAKAIMQQEPTLIAVQDDWRQQVPTLVPRYDQQQLQEYGLTGPELNAAIAWSLSGRQVGVFKDGDDIIPVVARAPATERSDQSAIERALVYSSGAGGYLTVGQFISDTQLLWLDAITRRINRVPTIMVQADPAPGVLTNDALQAVRDKVEAIELPAGYRLIWYGEYKASNDANAGIAASAPYGFAAMILAVVFMFNALRQPLVIWLTVPLAVVGVVAGLATFQAPFEFMAILGFLSLIGMMAKNAIVLVDQADADIAAGIAPYDAVVGAALSRARPVVLGAVTTILGVLPLIFDPFFKSMAITIMFGLLFATALTLVVIPLLYVSLLRIKSPARS